MKDTKTHLLKTSARLFAKKGYAGTSVREIVRQARVNVSAISYHFGDKRTLYLETIKYLLTTNRKYIFGGNKPLPAPQDVDNLSVSQMWEALRSIVERVLEMKFARYNLPLERIYTYVELEDSKEMLSSLLSYTDPLKDLLSRMCAKLTGVAEDSPKMILLINSIFWQVNLSECDRFMLLYGLGKSKYTKDPLPLFKQMIWQNVQSILKSYQEEFLHEKKSVTATAR